MDLLPFLEAMRKMPDNAFDLAVVDPPYGDGLGSQSVQVERERERAGTRGTDSAGGSTSTRLRFHGGSKNPKDPWNKYLKDRPLAQQLPTERERDAGRQDTNRGRMSDSRTEHGVMRTGGTWATKYTKKSLRGT